MAYTAGQLTLMASGNGHNHYRYDTLEASSAIMVLGYFNNNDDDLNLEVGDLITIIDWTGSVSSSGTIAAGGTHIVMTVGSTGAGIVDLGSVGAALVVTNTD